MKAIVLITILFFVINTKAKSQDKPQFFDAKISKIDTTDYYYVITATSTKDTSRLVILSPIDEAPNFSNRYSDSSAVKKDNVYQFYLQKSRRIKCGKDNYCFLHFEAVYWGKILIVQRGQLAYIALNMHKDKIYERDNKSSH